MNIKIVGDWEFESGQQGIEVYSGYQSNGDEVFKVEVDGKVVKVFKGEWAWADADRFAYDLIVKKIYA